MLLLQVGLLLLPQHRAFVSGLHVGSVAWCVKKWHDVSNTFMVPASPLPCLVHPRQSVCLNTAIDCGVLFLGLARASLGDLSILIYRCLLWTHATVGRDTPCVHCYFPSSKKPHPR